MDSRGMHNSKVQTDASSDEFVLYPTLPSLQEMAYNQIAIAVWYGYRSTPSQRHYGPWCYQTGEKLELMDCHKLMKTLTMPRFMKENLKKYLKRVRKETISCTQYFRYELFSYNLKERRIRQVDWKYFVWRPDGRIDYKSTANKMLHSGVLSEVQKFAIMSHFCLENQIKSFDLNRSPMKTFITKVNEDADYLLFYWISYLKKELYRTTPFFIRSFDHRHVTHSSTYYLDHARIKNHFSAFEYFWNRSSAEDQVSFISRRLSDYYSLRWYRSLFCNMSHDQFTNLLSRQPIAIISLFIDVWEMSERAIMAWNRCKNWISNEQFVELLQNLIHSRFDGNSFLRQEHKMSILLEIWNTANDHHKNYAAGQTQLEDAVVHLMYHWKKLPPSSFKFLLKFLSLKTADFRKKLILEGDPVFIFNFDFNVVREIFEVCMPNYQIGEMEFCTYPILHYYCEILYSEEDHDELNRRLLRSFQNLNISSNDVLKKFIKSSITANKRECKTYYPSNGNDESEFIRLNKFIEKTLQENVSAVSSMKQSYISSFSYHSDPFERYGSLHELSKLIEQEFVHEHLQELKQRLAEKLQTASVKDWVRYVLGYEKFTCIFSWCFENEERMFRRFQRRIPINNIVGKVLEKIIREGTISFNSTVSNFNSLERFLKWYFSGVAENVISFKLAIKNDCETARILEYFREHPRSSQRLRREFLQWNWPA